MKTISNPSPRDFNLMVLGQIISILGSALLRFALSLYILDITGREDIFAALYAISNIPLLLAPLGGAIADRFNRRNLMVIFDFTSSAIVLSLFLLISAGTPSVVLIGTIMVLLSVVSALYTPAVTASIPTLVAESKLESANGIVQAVQALSQVAAPVLGGILYGIIGAQILIIMSCTAFFLSAVMEMFIKIPFNAREHEEHIVPTITKDLKDGVAYIIKQPFILKSMLLAALINLVLSPLLVVGGPIILRVTLKSSDTMYGMGMGLINFASIAGALTIGLLAKKMRMHTLYRWILGITLMLLPITLSVTPFVVSLGYYPAFILFMLGAVPIATAATIISIFVVAKVQKVTPNENLGKVMAIIMAVAQCTAPLGQIIYGVLFKSFSTTLYLPILFVTLLMLVIAGISHRILQKEEPERNRGLRKHKGVTA